MNVKVVLLPDGEDPDSFARSHSASEFAEFIKQNETDFVRFKTKLLLEEAGNDPVKRAALIGDIIRTIAIVPDNITRTIYIRECSAKMEIDEQVVLNEVNKIRLARYEQNKQQRQQITEISQTASQTEKNAELSPVEKKEEVQEGVPAEQPIVRPDRPIVSKRSPYEQFEIALLRYVVRYGEQVLYDYTDEQTNEQVVIRVAEYIRSELGNDGLTFYTPIFKQMLDEAADHCCEDGFVAHRYFLAHPDPDVSRISANLISEKYQLSKYHSKYQEVEREEDRLEQLVIRDLFALKEAYILHQIREKQETLKQVPPDAIGQMTQIMEEITRLNEIKKVLSKELGERIVLKM